MLFDLSDVTFISRDFHITLKNLTLFMSSPETLVAAINSQGPINSIAILILHYLRMLTFHHQLCAKWSLAAVRLCLVIDEDGPK